MSFVFNMILFLLFYLPFTFLQEMTNPWLSQIPIYTVDDEKHKVAWFLFFSQMWVYCTETRADSVRALKSAEQN